MDAGKFDFTGIRRLPRRPILLAALALIFFSAGAALGWILIGSPLQRVDSREIVFSQPMQIIHNQMHSRMAGTWSPVSSPGQQPAAVVPVRFHDFGNVKNSDLVSRTFEIENQGEASLEISSGYTTCGCTSAALSAAVIPPGKSGLVTVTFDGRNLPAGTRVRRGVILETNDPQHPQLEIWIQASVTQ